MLIAILCTGLYAQKAEDKIKPKGFPKFPKITNTNIAGAPILGQPILVIGSNIKRYLNG